MTWNPGEGVLSYISKLYGCDALKSMVFQAVLSLSSLGLNQFDLKRLNYPLILLMYFTHQNSFICGAKTDLLNLQ